MTDTSYLGSNKTLKDKGEDYEVIKKFKVLGHSKYMSNGYFGNLFVYDTWW